MHDCRADLLESADTATGQCAAGTGSFQRGGVPPAADADATAAAGGGTPDAEAAQGVPDPAQWYGCATA